MADGFLGRWSRRKLEVKEGKPVEPEPPPTVRPEPVEGPGSAAQAQASTGSARTDVPEAPPPPTLDDVKALTPQSDFSAFTGRSVSPEVSNAAMKKLFTDPHYNIMDGLDTYIDDYSKPDPIPPAMLRQLASAKFLGLFDEEEKAEAEAAARSREVADDPTAQSVAQSDAPAPAVPAAPAHHADPDLRLQQDDAPPGEDPGRGAQ
jgi:hypothetical protein